jgi:hypothetical protein
MNLADRKWSLALARGVLAAILVSLPATGGAAQAGTFGDIYQRAGWLLGAEFEDTEAGAVGLLGVDYYSFSIRRAGHIIRSTGDTLLGGSNGGLVLYRAGGRRYLAENGRWARFVEGAIGLGAANAPFTTTDTTFYGGSDGALVSSLFVGAGVRTNGSGLVSGFASLRRGRSQTRRH